MLVGLCQRGYSGETCQNVAEVHGFEVLGTV